MPEHHHHGHGHGHGEDVPERLPDPSPVASVVLDIGEGVGALVVRTEAGLDGAELEIRRSGEAWRGVHTAVRRRMLPAGDQFAAVYGSLAEGRYELRVKGSRSERPELTVEVMGARVARAVWPAPAQKGRSAGPSTGPGVNVAGMRTMPVSSGSPS